MEAATCAVNFENEENWNPRHGGDTVLLGPHNLVRGSHFPVPVIRGHRYANISGPGGCETFPVNISLGSI